MSEVGSYAVEDGIGIITIDSPPVNALGIAVRRALAEGFSRFGADEAVKAIVLICAGRTFFAGADISEFGKPMEEPDLHSTLDVIENGSKPVVAAIHGTALGGGYEVALTCHYRIAVPSAKVGLPEVKLGILPGAGGTQRLPRIVGAAAALDIILGGDPVPARKALELGMIDELAEEGKLREDAIALARRILAEGRPLKRVRDRQDKVDPDKGNTALFDQARKTAARTSRGFKAPEGIIKAIEAAVELPFEQGILRERELFHELHDSVESEAQRYYFFAERQAGKIPDVPSSTERLPIKSVGVIGAGTMGGGIAMNFLNAGIPVTLAEMNQAALDRGIATIRKNYENTARKGRMTEADVEKRMGLITPAVGLEALSDADLVVEAVFEQMSIKKEVFAKLDGIAKPSAILASNTSFLNIDEIAAVTGRPEQVVGLHFFAPANVMRLLEVVRGEKTSKEVIATAMNLGIGKLAVLSRVAPGFIVNRIMGLRVQLADSMVLEGLTPAEVDKAIYDYGFPMGPFEMIDLVGLDVIGRDDDQRSLHGDLVNLGRRGQKTGGGFYDYDDKRNRLPSAESAQVIADFAKFKGIAPSGPQSAEEIVARLLYPMVNEGAKVLEEGVALRASDIDVACILGYGWPLYTGGPMFWGDTVGLPKIVAKLEALAEQHGEVFKPCALLKEKAASGGSFTR